LPNEHDPGAQQPATSSTHTSPAHFITAARATPATEMRKREREQIGARRVTFGVAYKDPGAKGGRKRRTGKGRALDLWRN